MTGNDLPRLQTGVPGPHSQGWVDRLAQRECPAITARRARRANALGVAEADPIVWEQSLGSNVLDVDGNLFVDFTAGFGVALVGHRHPRVVEAGQAQLARLPHAMGDAFPDPTRIRLLERLADWTGLDHGILGSSGSDAVEAALKTARMATGRDGVLAFGGGYHGLSYGALPVGDYKAESFRAPFAGQLGTHVTHMPFGEIPDSVADFGAVIIEPVQGRGGMRTLPPGTLARLAERCKRDGALLILDEIYTGFGRCGSRFAFEAEGVTPDLLCLGKGMASGFPLSACLGRREVMEAWGASEGEAIHTQTFLGNPVGCAMAMAVLDIIEEASLVERARTLGEQWREALSSFGETRGSGLMLGLEVDRALDLSRQLLERGWITLPAGETDPVLALVPPLTVSETLLSAFADTLADLL